jgi:transposase
MLHSFMVNRATAAFDQERTPHCHRDEPTRLACQRIAASRLASNVSRVVAYDAGRIGFRLARWLSARGVKAQVRHPSSVAVSRERRRAKTDRLDAALLLGVLPGWLRGESGHCSMTITPSIEDDDAKRPTREHEKLVGERTRIINRKKASLARLGVHDLNPAQRKLPVNSTACARRTRHHPSAAREGGTSSRHGRLRLIERPDDWKCGRSGRINSAGRLYGARLMRSGAHKIRGLRTNHK